jgi:hypothetical protein
MEREQGQLNGRRHVAGSSQITVTLRSHQVSSWTILPLVDVEDDPQSAGVGKGMSSSMSNAATSLSASP